MALLICLGLLLASLPAWAAEEPPTVTAQVLHSATAYPQGGSYPLVLRLAIRQGYHINASSPAEPDVYPTKLTLEERQFLSFNSAVFPSPRAYKPSFSDKPMQVYDGVLDLRLSFKVAPNAPAGPQVVKARLEFQACDDQSCLMPETLEVPVSITVNPAGKPGAPQNSELFRQTGAPKGKR